VATEQGQLLSPATVQRVLAVTSSFFGWAITVAQHAAGEKPMQRRVDHALGQLPERHQPFVGAAGRQQPTRRTPDAHRLSVCPRLPEVCTDIADERSQACSPMPHDGEMAAPEVAVFGDQVAGVLAGILGNDLVGVYFVGSVALGGYVPGESDVDIAAVSGSALSGGQKHGVASAIVDVSGVCPARGVEFTLYRRDVAGSPPKGADFEVNANGGPRIPTAVHLDAGAESGFWYVLDRAIAHRSGVVISGPPPRTLFVDVARKALLEAMYESMAWHRAHERATLYSVLNACRAWRFAEEDTLGSKLEGAAWARDRNLST